MDSPLKEYIIATVVIIVAVCVTMAMVSDSWLDIFITIVIMTAGYTCVVIGLYMFLEGKGQNAINGVDWSSLSDSEVRNMVSFWGFYFIIGSILLMYSVALLMSFIWAFVLILVSVAFLLVPLALKERGRKHQFVERSKTTKVLVFATVSIVAIVPTFYFMSMEDNSEAVVVEFGEDSFHIKAPMVDLTFKYEDVSDIGIDPDFDKGSRIWGYGTTNICSGKFQNAVFGKYTLASYTKVTPCVFFTCDGEYYAFNQVSVQNTYDAYETLIQKKA